MEDLDKWRKAGKITAQVREFSKKLVKKNAKLLDVANKIESKIRDLGAEPAFPVNISLNDCAAHSTAKTDDDAVFHDEVVKIDIGTHIDGCIGDTAVTVDLSGKHEKLLRASRDALEAAIKALKTGATIGEIGKAVQETITKFGYAPVRNLSGHTLEKYIVHISPNIPNIDTRDERKVPKDSIIAIEPFASTGRGEIYESGEAEIFSQISRKGVRNMITKNVLREIEKYNNLPFPKRWLAEKFGLPRVNLALRELLNLEVIKGYPPLVDKEHGIISQAEHTLYVGDEIEILTK